jgi:hypothetical protein
MGTIFLVFLCILKNDSLEQYSGYYIIIFLGNVGFHKITQSCFINLYWQVQCMGCSTAQHIYRCSVLHKAVVNRETLLR